jgi:hypothetical protein
MRKKGSYSKDRKRISIHHILLKGDRKEMSKKTDLIKLFGEFKDRYNNLLAKIRDPAE